MKSCRSSSFAHATPATILTMPTELEEVHPYGYYGPHRIANNSSSSSNSSTTATRRSDKLVSAAPPPRRRVSLTRSSRRAPRRILAGRCAALQAQPARAGEGPQAAGQGLRADREERPHHPHQHLGRPRGAEGHLQGRCLPRAAAVADNSMSVLRRMADAKYGADGRRTKRSPMPTRSPCCSPTWPRTTRCSASSS